MMRTRDQYKIHLGDRQGDRGTGKSVFGSRGSLRGRGRSERDGHACLVRPVGEIRVEGGGNPAYLLG